MFEALGDLEGVIIFVDDILVFGQGENYEEAVKDHDQKIIKLFERLRNQKIKLNADKVQFKQTKIKYMGHIITDQGIQIDNDKVKAIHDMKPPENVK